MVLCSLQQPQSQTDESTPDKVVLVLIDGVGDVTIPAFGDTTPLQVAHTPNLDAIAAAGVNGLVDAVEPGLACGSDTSHMNLLGYDPRKHYRGRGAFESMGAGLAMEPGDIAFKSNFACLNPETGIVERRRADRNFEHLGPQLCAALDGIVLPSFPQHAVAVRYATEHRCGVVVRGLGLSDAVSGTDPLHDGLPLLRAAPLDNSPEAAHTAAVVNQLSDELRRVLEAQPANAQRAAQGLPPANVVLLRGCGCRIAVPSFKQLHGMRAAIVAPTKIIAGLGLSFGVDVLHAPGTTGSYDSNFAAKAAAAAEALVNQDYDFVLLHVKAVDDTGHDRLLAMKVRYLEVVDRMIGHLLVALHDAEVAQEQQQQKEEEDDKVDVEQQRQQQQQDLGQQRPVQRYAVCVTGDHSTPVLFGDHSHEPVPLALARVCDTVTAMGGLSQLELRRAHMGERLPLPDMANPPPIEELRRQADAQVARRCAAADGVAWTPGVAAESGWREAWPAAAACDAVLAYNELSAARGCLGRFTGAGVMPLIKQFCGWQR